MWNWVLPNFVEKVDFHCFHFLSLFLFWINFSRKYEPKHGREARIKRAKIKGARIKGAKIKGPKIKVAKMKGARNNKSYYNIQTHDEAVC